MSEEIYEVLSLGMRYWFVLLGGLIVWRAVTWQLKERQARHQRLKQLPDAGLIGEMMVLRGSDELPEGTLIAMPYEGTLGFLRTSDVVVPVEGVAGQHLDFSFQPHVGLLIYPRRHRACAVDGAAITGSRSARRTPMVHGSVLDVGDAQLQLRLFAGLDTMPHRTAPAQPSSGDVPKQKTLFGQPIPDYPPWQEETDASSENRPAQAEMPPEPIPNRRRGRRSGRET